MGSGLLLRSTRVDGSGFWDSGLSGPECWVRGLGFRVSGFGLWVINEVQVLVFLVFGARILGFGFSVQECQGLSITDS